MHKVIFEQSACGSKVFTSNMQTRQWFHRATFEESGIMVLLQFIIAKHCCTLTTPLQKQRTVPQSHTMIWSPDGLFWFQTPLYSMRLSHPYPSVDSVVGIAGVRCISQELERQVDASKLPCLLNLAACKCQQEGRE